MPGFDGTGPRGLGPLTGRGNGFCMIPVGNRNKVTYGISGINNNPVNSPHYYSGYYNSSFGPGRSYPYSMMGTPGYTGRTSSYFRRGNSRLASLRSRGMSRGARRF